MVDTAELLESLIMEDKEIKGMLSAPDVMKELDISKMTLYKWILQRKIKAKRYQFGTRTVLAFSPEEIKRVKSLMVKKREKGKSLIK